MAAAGFDWGSAVEAIPAVASMFDSIFGGDDSGAAKKQYKLAKDQFKFMKQMSTSGTDNGRGLKTFYDPTTNSWKVDLSGIAAILQDASDAGEARRLLETEPRNQQSRYENSLQRESMRPIIDSFINQLRNRTDITPEALQGDLDYLSNSAADEAYGKVQNDIATTALRTPGAMSLKSGPVQSLVDALAKTKSDNRVQNRLTALTQAEELNSGAINNKINQINSLGAQAFNFDDVPFNPSQLSSQGLATAQSSRNAAPQFSYAGMSGLSDSINNLSRTQDNNKWGDIGVGLAGILKNFGSAAGSSNTLGKTSSTLGNKMYNTRVWN